MRLIGDMTKEVDCGKNREELRVKRMLSGWICVSVFRNISAVERAKVGRASGRDTMEAFWYYCLLIIFFV